MPRKKSSKATEAESVVTKATSAPQLIALVKAKSQAVTKVQPINGEIGSRIKEASDNGSLHKRAFSVICAADRMAEDQRNDFFRSLDLYRDHMAGQWGDGEHAGDLVEQASSAVMDEEEIVEQNRRRIEKGIHKLESADAPGSYSIQH